MILRPSNIFVDVTAECIGNVCIQFSRTLFGELAVEYIKSATIRNIHVFVLQLQIKDPMIGFAVKS